MSLQSWKEIYYPKPPSKRMTKRQAIEHSLLKWTGLLPKNLEKHGLVRYGVFIQEENDGTSDLSIDAESCALCVKFFKDYAGENETGCENCPLQNTIGKACDGSEMSEKPEKSKYGIWRRTGDPRPMIRALKKTLKALEK